MTTRKSFFAWSLIAGLLLVPLAASADSHEPAPKPLTWISYVKAQTGKGQATGSHIAESGAKIYDGLMADGHVLSWGVGMPINHRADDAWNVVEWVTFRDWAGVDAFMASFMAMEGAKTPEEKQAAQEEWYSLVEPGSHYDEILRHEVMAPAEGRPFYIGLTNFPSKPGQTDALRELWEETMKPTMEKLQAEGKVGSSGMASTVMHDASNPPAVVFWTHLPNLAARDAIDAAGEAAEEARGEEAQKELMMKFASAVDFSGHNDRILLVTHWGGDGGDGE